MKTWQTRQGMQNEVLERNGFYISYNPDASSSRHIAQVLGEALGLDRTTEETALVGGGAFRILKGDFRKEYEDCGDDWDKCLAFYASKKESYGSNWSTEIE